jgi:hypothetical protein
MPTKKTRNVKNRNTRRKRLMRQHEEEQPPSPNNNALSPISKILGIDFNNIESSNDYRRGEYTPYTAPCKKNTVLQRSYSSNMAYDGKKMVIDTQRNNEPHKIITIQTMNRTNPLAAKLIKRYLNNRIPHSLKRRPKSLLPHISIQPVLPIRRDLGLIKQSQLLKNRNDSNDNDNDNNEYQYEDIDIENDGFYREKDRYDNQKIR